jgi:hypothetical protein
LKRRDILITEGQVGCASCSFDAAKAEILKAQQNWLKLLLLTIHLPLVKKVLLTVYFMLFLEESKR